VLLFLRCFLLFEGQVKIPGLLELSLVLFKHSKASVVLTGVAHKSRIDLLIKLLTQLSAVNSDRVVEAFDLQAFDAIFDLIGGRGDDVELDAGA
jgi:IS30 family transposase